jgi:hypothetical protein
MKTFFFHKYPRLSQFWCVLAVTFVMTFDPTYILSYLIALITVVYGLNRPQVAVVMRPYLQRIFFDHKNIYYKTDLRVATIDDRDLFETKREQIQKYAPANQ